MTPSRLLGCRRRELWCIILTGSAIMLWVSFGAKWRRKSPSEGSFSAEHREALRKKYWTNFGGAEGKTPNVVDLLPEYVIDVEPAGVRDGTKQPLIPHIFHQVWDSTTIPEKATEWVRSWKLHHPNWEYWLWTPTTGRQLISKAFPSYLTLYDSYTEDIFRIDAMRLFVLYAFGGVYIDLDMVSLKPMDTWTYAHDCLLTHETYEHSFIVSDKNETNVVNGFMACRPKHPFFALAIKMLPDGARHYFGDFLQATGPFFLDRVFKRWKEEHTSTKDAVSVLHPKYFLPTFDPTLEAVISSKCSPLSISKLLPVGQALCREVWHRNFRNSPSSLSYADHKWVHFYMYGPKWKAKDSQNISLVIFHATDTSVMVTKLNVKFNLK